MRRKFITGLLLMLAVVLIQPVFGQLTYTESQPRQIVLTWQNDPSTTMTITWRTDIRGVNHKLRFSEKPDAKTRKWKTLEAETFTFDETSAWLHTVELTNLKPGQKYYVEIDHPNYRINSHFKPCPMQTTAGN